MLVSARQAIHRFKLSNSQQEGVMAMHPFSRRFPVGLFFLLTLTLTLPLAGCGGGGGGGGGPPPPAPPRTYTVSTFAGLSPYSGADGTGALATFNGPYASVSDGAGNLYVADSSNDTIRKIVIATGAVTTVAGQVGVSGAADGTGTAATFSVPEGIATDGIYLYVVDTGNNKIRKISPSNGTLGAMTSATAVVSSLTGSANKAGFTGAADNTAPSSVTFFYPNGITTDGTNLYVADTGNNKIRKVVIATGATSSVTGLANTAVTAGAADNATATSVSFHGPQGITTDGANLYVADAGNNKVRKVVISSGATTSLTGPANTAVSTGAADNTTAASVSFYSPFGVTIDSTHTNLYVADTLNNKIRKVVISSGATSSFTGVANTASAPGFADGSAATATFIRPQGIFADGTNLYVADTANNTIRYVFISGAQVFTLAGAGGGADGTGMAARFDGPYRSTTDGVNLYVTNCGNYYHEIRKVVIATGVVTTLAGSGVAGSTDGLGTAAAFNCPRGITTDGTNLYVVDGNNNKIRKISPSSGPLSAMTSANAVVTSLTGAPNAAVTAGSADGPAGSAAFDGPDGITTDGINLYVVDWGNGKIREISPSGATLSTMTSATAAVSSLTGAANAVVTRGAMDGPAGSATFYPGDITTDGVKLYVADYGNNKIREISPSSGTLGAMTSANAVVTSLTGTANTAMANGAADGTALSATFDYNKAITTDGFKLYVADMNNNKIRMIAPASGATLSTMTSSTAMVSSLTGTPNAVGLPGYADGTGSVATFYNPAGIITDGISLYVTDTGNSTLRQIK